MNITPEQVARIDALRITPDEGDDRAALDVQIRVAECPWDELYRDELPHSAVYARIVWTPDTGDGEPRWRYARTWLLDGVGETIYSSEPRDISLY